jgi:hypothetical protein
MANLVNSVPGFSVKFCPSRNWGRVSPLFVNSFRIGAKSLERECGTGQGLRKLKR